MTSVCCHADYYSGFSRGSWPPDLWGQSWPLATHDTWAQKTSGYSGNRTFCQWQSKSTLTNTDPSLRWFICYDLITHRKSCVTFTFSFKYYGSCFFAFIVYEVIQSQEQQYDSLSTSVLLVWGTHSRSDRLMMSACVWVWLESLCIVGHDLMQM